MLMENEICLKREKISGKYYIIIDEKLIYWNLIAKLF